MTKRIIAALAALIMTLALVPAIAATTLPEPADDFWVLDQANVLSDETKGEIFFANLRLANDVANEVVVVTVRTTGDYTIDDYCYALFNQWGINGEGALVLLAVDDDDYYTMPGSVLGVTLTSSEISSLQNDALEKDFAAKNYDAGVRKYFEALYNRVAAIAGVNVTAADGVADYEAWLAQGEEETDTLPAAPVATRAERAEEPAPVRREREERSLMGPVLVVILLIVVFLLVAKSRRGRRRTTYYDDGYTAAAPRGGSGFARGFLWGSLLNSRDRRPPAPGPGPAPRSGNSAAPIKPTPMPRNFSSPSAPRGESNGFGGASRSTTSRPTSPTTSRPTSSTSSRPTSGIGSSIRSSISRSSGFGGASRSGRSMGSGTRGGGAGRSGRR